MSSSEYSVEEIIAEIEKNYGIELNRKGYQGPLGLKKLEEVCLQIEAGVAPTNTDEKQAMIDELSADYGKDLNITDYEGPQGYGMLRGYYEGVKGAAADAQATQKEAAASSKPEKKNAKGAATPPA